MDMKKFFLSGLLVVFLSGCASAPVVDIPNLEESSAVKVTNDRAEHESDDTIFSLMITNDAYGIYRNNDEAIVPSPMRQLQHRVYEKYQNTNKPVELHVHHMLSYTNSQATLKKSAWGSMFGAVGAAIAAATQNNNSDFFVSEINPSVLDELTGDDEYKLALYSKEENPNKANVFIIYIDAEINGIRKSIRTVSPALVKENETTPPYVSAINNSINEYLKLFEG